MSGPTSKEVFKGWSTLRYSQGTPMLRNIHVDRSLDILGKMLVFPTPCPQLFPYGAE